MAQRVTFAQYVRNQGVNVSLTQTNVNTCDKLTSQDRKMLSILSAACDNVKSVTVTDMMNLSTELLSQLWQCACDYGLKVDNELIQGKYSPVDPLDECLVFIDGTLAQFNSLKKIPCWGVGAPIISFGRVMIVMRLTPARKHAMQYKPYTINHKTGDLQGRGITAMNQYTHNDAIAKEKITSMEVTYQYDMLSVAEVC